MFSSARSMLARRCEPGSTASRCCRHSKSAVMRSQSTLKSPRDQPSKMLRTSSTFSCDIACPVSRLAPRSGTASSRSHFATAVPIPPLLVELEPTVPAQRRPSWAAVPTMCSDMFRPTGGGMTDDHDLPMTEYRRAGLEITRGNPEVYKSLWSRRDDVTLANPFGPPVRGWQEVSDRLDLAAGNYRDGRDYDFENISTVITPELAYTVEIDRKSVV